MTERTDPRPVAETGAPNPDAHTSGVPRTANERPKHGPQRGMGHGPMQGLGSAEKAVSFVPSAKRLLGMMRPERNLIIVVVVISAVATLGNAVGPAILAQGTDLIFAGATGGGIDFAALAMVIWQALGVYVFAGVVLWFASYLINDIVQRTVYRMREAVATKLNRLPITYFDGQPRGELLSRVTNDIDNIAQSLQQTLAQMLNNIFTVIGVLALMFWLSPPLALVVLISVPLTVLVTAQVMNADPTFDAGNAQARLQMRKQFADTTNTKPGGTMAALNTLGQHLEHLSDLGRIHIQRSHRSIAARWMNARYRLARRS